jgi:hypothetical protein
MIDMACKSDELHDFQGLFAEARSATAIVLEKLEATPSEESAVSVPLHTLPELLYSPEGHWQAFDH